MQPNNHYTKISDDDITAPKNPNGVYAQLTKVNAQCFKHDHQCHYDNKQCYTGSRCILITTAEVPTPNRSSTSPKFLVLSLIKFLEQLQRLRKGGM